jgi:hypothetical protein
VAASTAVAYRFDWSVAGIRLGAGYVIAVGVGVLMGSLFRRDDAVLPKAYLEATHHGAGAGDCCETISSHLHGRTTVERIIGALSHAAGDFFDIARFLVLGAFFAAAMQTFVDRTAFLLFAEFPGLSILLMMALAVLLNLCSEADAFVAASMRFLVPMPAQMAFMVLGPMLDVKLVFMYMGVFKKRAIVTIGLMSVILVFLSMILLNALTTGTGK